MYFRKIHLLHLENVPSDAPLMIVSNHQNGACDVLSILLFIRRADKTRKIRSVTRGDVMVHPVGNVIMRWLGIVPAYRIAFEGEASLGKNAPMLEMLEEEILNDGTIILFPEANHQTIRWFGWFSPRYLLVMLEAARKSNFEKEMYLLPSCNHYNAYAGIHDDTLIKFGTPIALSAWYEKYQKQPKATVREINGLVKRQISDLMLNITDLDNYAAIDFLRKTYGVNFARRNSLNPAYLPDKLQADKDLFARLEALKAVDAEKVQKIYDDALQWKEKTQQLGIFDWNVDERPAWKVIWQGMAGLILCPVFILSLIINVLIFGIPKFIHSKIDDINTHCTINIPSAVLVSIPLTFITLFVLSWLLTDSFLAGMLCIASWPLLSIFLCFYYRAGERWVSRVRFLSMSQKTKTECLLLRQRIYHALDRILF
ncbi:MAG: 1-acyl-sn-glycerol-3-phosphate acyltransferase [Bacteroidales bacterium]|nr:1-acyl-sn-glycerol-3-phosphate acyltransferase [Bacteroidales bacterium]